MRKLLFSLSPGCHRAFQNNLACRDPILRPDDSPEQAEVIRSVCEEMARTVEDFPARRSRALLLDTRASIEMAPGVARIMAAEQYDDNQWQADQVTAYTRPVQEYLLVQVCCIQR